MTIVAFDIGASWTTPLAAAGGLALGLVAGWLYFRSVWWHARLLSGSRPGAMMLVLLLGRFTILAGLLALASLAGALPLLMTALGVLIARGLVMRRIRMLPP